MIQTALWINYIGTLTVFWLLSALLALWLYFTGSTHEAFEFSVALIATTGLVGLLKLITKIPRPRGALVTAPFGSFPSGHTASVVFLATTAPVVLATHIGEYSSTLHAVLWVVACIVAASRLILKVHTPLQVIVGALIGYLVPTLVLLLLA